MRALIALSLACPLLLGACSGGEEPAEPGKNTGGHVWQSQTDALKEAQQTADMVNQATEAKIKALEEQN